MTSKQRAFLRGMANTIDPIFQVGKGNIEENFIKQVDQALLARELIKITVLKAATITPREVADFLCQKARAECVQVIGQRLVLYRRNHEKPMIELP